MVRAYRVTFSVISQTFREVEYRVGPGIRLQVSARSKWLIGGGWAVILPLVPTGLGMDGWTIGEGIRSL